MLIMAHGKHTQAMKDAIAKDSELVINESNGLGEINPQTSENYSGIAATHMGHLQSLASMSSGSQTAPISRTPAAKSAAKPTSTPTSTSRKK